jgi:hypothetical protein
MKGIQFMNKIGNFKRFMIFMYYYMKMGFIIFKNNLEWKTHNSSQNLVVTVTFDPLKIKTPESLMSDIRNQFSDAYSSIHGYAPIILVVPTGYRFQFLEASEFVDCLPPIAKKNLKTALYQLRENEIY